MFYERNIKALRTNPNLKELWSYLNSLGPDPTGTPLTTIPDKPNLLVERDGQQRLLHLPDDPEAEVPQFLELVPEDSYGIVMMFGMGLGYSPLAIIRERPNIHHLFIFEANPGILARAMELMDLTPLLSSSRVTIYVPDTWDIGDCLRKCGAAVKLEDIHFLHHLPSIKVDPSGFYKDAYDEVFKVVNAENITGNTFAAFGLPITSNRFEHLKLIPFQPFIDELRDAMKDLPAILVAAGPSLDKNIDRLKDAVGKAVIFAVDSAVPPLINRGIYPDFVCSIDFQEITFEKLSHARSALEKRPPRFICTLWNAPSMFKRIQWRETYRVICHHQVDYWINELVGPKTIFPGAETVAHLNLLSAIFMGCSPIILIGQDLAYGPGRSHSSDVILKSAANAERQGADLMRVKGNVDDEVVTDRSFFGMIKSFESMMSSNPNLYINATEGGAYIEGTEVMPLASAIAEHCKRPVDLEEMLPAFEPGKKDLTSVVNGINKMLKRIDKARSIIKRSDKLTAQAREFIRGKKVKGIEQLPMKYQKLLYSLEKVNAKLDKDNQLWGFVECMTIHSVKAVSRMKLATERVDDMDYGRYVEESLDRTSFVNKERMRAMDWLGGRLSDALDFIRHYRKWDALKGQEKITLLRRHGMFQMLDDWLSKQTGPLGTGEDGEFPAIGEDPCILRYEIAAALRKTDGARARLNECRESGDPGQLERLKEAQERVALEFAPFIYRFVSINRSTARELLLRGLALAPDSDGLRQYLSELAALEIQRVQGDEEGKGGAVAAEWCRDMLQRDWLADMLSNDHLALFLSKGIPSLIVEGDHAEAEALLRLASRRSLLEAEAESSLRLELYINKGDFQGAVELLKDIDAPTERWKRTGEAAIARGDLDSAIVALETAFLKNPADIELIAPLTQCYMEKGGSQLATEALQTLRARLQGNNDGNQARGTD